MGFFDVLSSALTRTPWKGLVAPALQLALLSLRFDRSHRWRSQRLLVGSGLQLSIRAFQERDPVVFTSLFTPPELLHAMDVVPFGLEPAGVGAALMGIGSVAAADRAWAPADSCTVLRSALGIARMGLLPQPMAVVSTSCFCDSTPRVARAVAEQMGNVPFRLLDVPYSGSREAVAYLASQLEGLAVELAELSGRRLRPERLTEALELSNRARAHLETVNALRLSRPGLFDAVSAQDFVYPLSTLLGSSQGETLFRSFAEELAEADSHRGNAAGPRLLWMHLLPYYQHGFLETAERAGAQIVFEELSQISWDELDPGKPWESLARRCIGHYWNGPIDRRIEEVVALVRQFRVDGAVHFSHHGCRQSWGALRVVRDALAEEGVPLLELEGDLVDVRDRVQGQHHTRLEAFVEMLRDGNR